LLIHQKKIVGTSVRSYTEILRNHTTTITYTLSPNPSPLGRGDGVRVSLKIYDMLGREIVTLVNEEQQPGIYSVQFNARQTTGGQASQLSSGIYFYTLRAGNFSETKRMTLVK